MREIYQKRIKTLDIWLGRDDAPSYSFLVEAYEKQNDGHIRHLVRRFNRKPSLKTIQAAMQRDGVISERPYQLGQACDGSIGETVLALFYRFCCQTRRNPDALIEQAYPGEARISSWLRISEFAEWQGVDYPRKWTKRAVHGLIRSLHNINYHQLANLVSEEAES